jgi:protein TonB
MFEQSIVATQPANKTWTLGVSILAQISLVSAAILFPLVYTDNLPGLSQWVEGLVMPPPAATPKPLPEQPQRAATQSTVNQSRVFTEPGPIPTRVDMSPDKARIETTEISVPWGIDSATLTNPVSRYIPHIDTLPKPPAKPAVTVTKPHEETSAPMPVSGGVQEAKLLRKIIPIYPQIAIVTRVQGTVHLMGVISKDGAIRDLQVIDGNPLLVRAALDAVRQWIYRPTLLTGKPVEVVAPIVVTFTLNR